MLTAQVVDADGDLSVQTTGQTPAEALVLPQQVVESSVGTTEFDDAVVRVHAQLLAGLDPAAGILVRAGLVVGADGRRVVLAVHHLAVDVLANETGAALALVQLAVARAQIALDPRRLVLLGGQRVPPACRIR